MGCKDIGMRKLSFWQRLNSFKRPLMVKRKKEDARFSLHCFLVITVFIFIYIIFQPKVCHEVLIFTKLKEKNLPEIQCMLFGVRTFIFLENFIFVQNYTVILKSSLCHSVIRGGRVRLFYFVRSLSTNDPLF